MPVTTAPEVQPMLTLEDNDLEGQVWANVIWPCIYAQGDFSL